MAMKKLDLAPLQPQAARGFRYLQVPRLLIEDENYKAGEWSIFQCLDVDNQAAEEIVARQLYDTGVGIGPGDKLLTLVTCEYSQRNGRLAVIAKRKEGV